MTPPGMPERPYGPQTGLVRRFLQQFASLSGSEWNAIAAAYAEASGTVPAVAADRDLARAVERAGRVAERDAVLGPLAQLVQVDQGVQVQSAEGTGGPDQAPALHPVAEAALAALLALVVRDVLPPRAFTTLYAPFEDRIPVQSLDR